MTQRQLLGNRFDDHDWIKIANIDFDGSRKAEDIKNVWQNSEHPSINKEQWSSQETQQLIEIAERCGCVDWEWITSELKTNRTAYMCLQKYQEYNKDLKKKEWTKEEDQMLTELVQKMRVGNFIPYTKIAYFMEGRNASQLLFHWSKSLDPTLKRGPWSRTEDKLLLKAVAKYGSRDWFKIQEEIPGRVDSQCRDRYMNTLNQNVKKGKWTEEEENTFKSLLEKHGVGNWTKIAAELPGRTGTQCYSKWKVLTSVKKSAPQQGTRKRKRRRQRWDSSSEESSEDSDEEDDKILEELEEDEDDEQEEDSEEEQEVVQNVKQEKLIETIVLDVDRWIPVVENDQQTTEKSINLQAGNTAIEQPVNNWSAGSQSCRGRPRSSKIWKIFSKPTSPVPCVGEANVKPAESVSSELTAVPEPDPPSKLALCPTANDAQQEPPQSQRDPKRARRRLTAAHLSERDLDRSLLAEISRWTTARPLVRRQIDVLREALEATGLSSTSVFVLLLQVFRIDKERCLQIIKDKTNTATEILPASKSEDKSRAGPYLNEVKGKTIDVGNGQMMEMTRFKLSAEPLREKPKTVQQLLSERRRAGVSTKASRPAPKPIVIPGPLIIQQPLRLTLLPQPAASSKAPACPGLQLTQQPSKLPSVHTMTSRSQTRSATRSTVKQVECDKPVAGTQELSSGPAKGQGEPAMTPSPHTTQVCSSAVVKPVKSLGTASASNAASVHPAAARHRGKRLQPIAPAPQPTISSPLMVQLMLPNSTVPVMALVTPQGLLYIPPGTVMGPPSQNSLATATVAVGSQVSTAVVPTVPLGGASSSMSSATATQVPLSSLSAPSQSVNSGPSVAPVQTISIATSASAQPQNSASLTVSRVIPPSSSSTQIQLTQTPAPANSGASAPSLTSASSATLSAAGHVDPNIPTLSSTAQLNQESGCSRMAMDSPSIGSSCTQPSTLTHSGGTKLPGTQLQSDKTSIDFKLLCDDKDPITKRWLDGEGGVRVPGTQTTLPYLPPFASTLRGFSNLLLHKKVLEQNLPACEAADVNEPFDPKKSLEEARVLVNKQLQNNPAYQLLKARFLSIFTLPAFLATLPPKGTLTTIGSLSDSLNQDSTEESEYMETDVESEEGLPEHHVTDEGTDREPNQPFEIPSDLSFGCDLLGSLDPIVEDESNAEPPKAPEVCSTPEGEIPLPTRRSHRLRKNP